jgi:predicted secreted protein
VNIEEYLQVRAKIIPADSIRMMESFNYFYVSFYNNYMFCEKLLRRKRIQAESLGRKPNALWGFNPNAG